MDGLEKMGFDGSGLRLCIDAGGKVLGQHHAKPSAVIQSAELLEGFR